MAVKADTDYMVAHIGCYKCQWDDQLLPYTIIFRGVNPHAYEFALYNEDGATHEYHTIPLGPPAWRVMFKVEFKDLPYNIRRNVAKRYKELWKASRPPPVAS